MNAIIIDDEPYCVEFLEALIQKYCPHVAILGTFTKVEEALPALRTLKPDILFLDIEMPRMNGFELLEKFLPQIPFFVVFTTAYDRYAIRAFRFGAIDYLLKPINRKELVETVERLHARNATPISDSQLSLAKGVNLEKLPEKIAFSTLEGLHIVTVKDILYCKSEGCYTHIHIRNQPTLLISKPIKDLSDLLDGETFMRIHHSYLINLKEMRKYIRGEGGEVEMSNGDILPVSRTKKNALLELFTKI